MDWQRIFYSLPGVLLGLTVHEFCHALCAWKLGDNTARDQGRLTLNPFKHIDIIGLLFIIFAGFGWAKPVQFAPENLRNLRRDKALIAAAGPLSNLVLGILLIFIIKAMFYFNLEFDGFIENLFYVLYVAASINFGLFIFNLLPIPPLDGSHIVFSGLNIDIETEINIRKIGLPFLFLILIIQNQLNITIIPIGKMVRFIIDFFL
jgi:Zn-dependent protease